VCLKVVDDWFERLPMDQQRAQVKRLEAMIDAEGAGYDFAGHRDAPPGLRIWCGATVETRDVEALLPWLDWAYAELRRAAAA
jgi:phosphoserine aminotransferase